MKHILFLILFLASTIQGLLASEAQQAAYLNSSSLTFSIPSSNVLASNFLAGANITLTFGSNGVCTIACNFVTASATNAIAFVDGSGTNLTLYANSISKPALALKALIGSITNLWQLFDSNGIPFSFVSSNIQFRMIGINSNTVTVLYNGSTNQNTNIFEVRDSAGNLNFGVNTNGIATLPVPIIPHVSTNNGLTDSYYVLGQMTGGAFGTSTVFTNGNIRLVPFYSGAGGLIDSVAVNVLGAVGSSTVRMGIFQSVSATNLYPGSMLLDCGQFDSSTTGFKITNLVTTVRLLPGKVYWSGTTANAAITVSAETLNMPINILGYSTNATANTSIEAISVYGAFPTTAPLTNYIWKTTSQTAPAVFVRFSAP